MEKGSATVMIGVGGWEHEAFDQCFYPRAGAGSLEKLSYYTRFFETVEVRPAFWDDAISAEDAMRWVDAVKESKHFLINVKLHQSFTHKRELKPQSARQIRGVLQALAQHDRLGALLMQFPYSFTNTSANRFHLIRLAEVFAGYPMRVEFRHDSWNQASTWDILQEHSVSLVNAPDGECSVHSTLIDALSGVWVMGAKKIRCG